MASVFAKALRKNPTVPERFLWRQLRLKQLSGHRFRRQHSLGRYIVDFVCLEKRLVIEIDGGQHMVQSGEDVQRTLALNGMGFGVLRFWNHEVLQNIQAVKEKINMVLTKSKGTPLLGPPPQGGRRKSAI